MNSHRLLSGILVLVLIGLVSLNQYSYDFNSASSSVASNISDSEFNATTPAIVPELVNANPAASLNLPLDVDSIRSILAIRLVSAAPSVPPVIPPPANILAESALVFNLTTDRAIWMLEPAKVWPLASVTKLMTALVALENIGSAELVTISESAVATPEVAGDLRPAEVFSVADLIKSLFLVSSNDAASALAEHYGYDRFISRLNVKAAELGMTDTFFADPSGLSDTNVATARDLSLLLRYLYHEHQDLLSISALPSATITDRSFGTQKNYTSINQFSLRPDFLGGKTGYTDLARGNLVSVFNLRGNVILTVVLGTADRFAETEKLLDWLELYPDIIK